MPVSVTLRSSQANQLSWTQVDNNFSVLAGGVNANALQILANTAAISVNAGLISDLGIQVAAIAAQQLSPSHEFLIPGNGTDPGTFLVGATSFTLQGSYQTLANLTIHYDSSYQGGDQFVSLIGKTVTTTSPLPAGVLRISVDAGLAQVLGVPSQGSVGVGQLAGDVLGYFVKVAALALSTGAGLVGWIRSATGAVAKTLAQWLGYQTINLFDFMTDAQIADVKSNNATIDVSAAVQAAINSLPLNTASVGILSPLGFANGGKIKAPAGRYKIANLVTFQRGFTLEGEGREATQFISFLPGTVFQYLDSGRYVPDEINVRDLSIWQDPSVVATSGAAIEAIDGPASTDAICLNARNVLINGTFKGIRLAAGIGSAVRDSLSQNTVSHGFELDGSGGLTLSTSVAFQNTYSQLSQTGSGFNFINCAYCDTSSTASDSNARYGYELNGTTNIRLHGGAEANGLGGVLLTSTRSTDVSIEVVDNAGGTSSAVTLDGCFGTTIKGVHHSSAGAAGYSINVIGAGGAITTLGLVTTGPWSTTNQFSTEVQILSIGTLTNGFLGGIGKRWSFGAASPGTANQVLIGGNSDSGVTNGLVINNAHGTAGSSNSMLYAQFTSQATAVTYTVANGVSIPDASKGASSTLTRLNGIYVADQTQGANANANIALGTSSPAVGTWNIYSASIRDNVWFGKQRYLSSTGPTQSFGTGSPEGVLTAPIGSQYGRTDGGAATSFYVKESGAGNTGWIAK